MNTGTGGGWVIWIVAAGHLIAGLVAVQLPLSAGIGVAAGYVLGFTAVLIHYLLAWYIKDKDDRTFFEWYYLGIFLRFLFILALFSFLLIATEIEQISFTLSFIISYILHSVIDIILINKTYKKDPG